MIAKEMQNAAADLARALPEIDVGTQDRERYARDQSPFRVLPAAVARPRDADEVAALVGEASRRSLPVIARAGGSSVAGQCLGKGLIVDLAGLDEVEPDAESVACGPGVVLAELNARLAHQGRQIGPDTTSSPIAMIGGLVATNACGARSLKYGRFGDDLLEVDAVLADGSLHTLREGDLPDRLAEPLARVGAGLDGVLEDWPHQHRSFGGYRLDEFARRGDALSLVPGSEGTLCVVTRARLRTVRRPERRVLEAVGYADLKAALDAAPAFAEHGAAAVEVLDEHLLDSARTSGLSVPAESQDRAMLLIEYLDCELPEASGVRLEGKAAQDVWLMRDKALLLATGWGRIPVAVFEDPAVKPEHVARFYTALEALLQRFGLDALVYGHAAAGCLHVRPFCESGDPEFTRRLEACLPAVADLVGEWGGAITGEHGWGLARSYLAPTALGHGLYERFRGVKRAFDPAGVLNPGKIVGGQNPFVWLDPA